MSIRSFIAIPLNKPMSNSLGDIAAKMAYQDKSNAVRWVDQANYHITLAFLGDQNEGALETLAEGLDEQLPHAGFELFLNRLSPFPESRPKLIAAMVDKSDALHQLHQQVLGVVAGNGINIERKKLLPHVTLGRYRHTKNQFAGAIPTSLNLLGEVTEVSIFESVLTPNGAEYEALFRFPLNEYEYDEL